MAKPLSSARCHSVCRPRHVSTGSRPNATLFGLPTVRADRYLEPAEWRISLRTYSRQYQCRRRIRERRHRCAGTTGRDAVEVAEKPLPPASRFGSAVLGSCPVSRSRMGGSKSRNHVKGFLAVKPLPSSSGSDTVVRDSVRAVSHVSVSRPPKPAICDGRAGRSHARPYEFLRARLEPDRVSRGRRGRVVRLFDVSVRNSTALRIAGFRDGVE